MKFKFITLYLMFQSYVMSNLTNHDFCMNVNRNECSGKFSYECKPDKCAFDKTACQYYNSLVFGLNLRKSSAQEINKFNDFKRFIKNCTTVKYEWRAGDFCLNKAKCFSYDFNVILGIWEEIKTTCACTGKHSYKCNENICSTNKTACKNLNKEKNIFKRKAATECLK